MTEPTRSTNDGRPLWSAHIHESLDAHEAQAAELRRELEDVRRTLDPPAPVTGEGRHRRPRRLLAKAVVVLLVLALAAGLAVLLTHRSGARAAVPPAGPAASAAPSATGTSAAPSGAPGAAAPATGASVAAGANLPPWPGGATAEPPGLPATGPGADTPGSEVTVALDADRHVDVYERALLAPGARVLALRPADPPAVARSLVTGLPAVQDLHVDVDGQPARVTTGPRGWTVAVPAGVSATRVVLRYRLDDALVRREPSPAGRYTLVLRPLAPSAGRGAGAAVVVRVPDGRVEELYCPGAADQLCGATAGTLHTATVPRGAPPVVIGLVTLLP